MTKLILAIALVVPLFSISQLTTPPDGGNKKAVAGERIGLTDVTIHYDRPGVKGREGQIWGKLVGYGFTDLGFGTSKAAPWRAGANENTTIEFSTDVNVEGHPLAAGIYGFFIAVGPDESTLIFSKNSTSWGSFFYNEKEDALRVKIKPVSLNESNEWLKYEFTNETDTSAVVNLVWEKKKFPFTVEADLKKLQIESFRKELRTDKGFRWNAWNEAARYCLNNKINLDEGMTWANKAVSEPFVGEANFVTLSTKADYLVMNGKSAEADSLMKKAIPLGNMNQLHNYGRQLLVQKRAKEAFDVFKINHDKNPDTFTTNMGMTRGYSAVGNYKKAAGFALKALAQAPDAANKSNIEGLITKLQQGKDIN